jgi:hypothetical protein
MYLLNANARWEIEMSVISQRKAELENGAAPRCAVPETGHSQNSSRTDLPAQPLLKAFFSKEELAAELGRNPRTLDRWEILGTGPPRTYIGREVRYRRTSVQRWLAAQEQSCRRSSEIKLSQGKATL